MPDKKRLMGGFLSLGRKFSTRSNSNSNSKETVPSTSKTNIPKDDDAYAVLASYDIKFLIDDSASMGCDFPSRWDQVSKALEDIAPICTRYDSDGVDVHFLNEGDRGEFKGIRKDKTVKRIFESVRPSNGTPTARRLQDILSPYVDECVRRHHSGLEAPRPLNLIVITDGLPERNPEDVLLSLARRLDEIEAIGTQLGVQFCQVGDDADAAESLRTLDDDLHTKHDCRDFIDTVPYNARATGGAFDEELVLKTLLGSILRRHDKVKIEGAKKMG